MATVGLGLVLWGDTLRRVYAAGKTANDHFVAAVVTGCFSLYLLLGLEGPAALHPLWFLGVMGLWGLFYLLHRGRPPGRILWWGLGVLSQLSYSFALWAGLLVVVYVPLTWLLGITSRWPGMWLLFPVGLSLGGVLFTLRHRLDVRRFRVPGLPLRVVHLSDLHASPLMYTPELHELVTVVNGLSPDVVLITGDFVMPFSERDHAYLLKALSEITAPVFGCPGNHDLPALPLLCSGMAQVGVRLLVDESQVLHLAKGSLTITGVNFHWGRARERLEKVMESLTSLDGNFHILLAHDPRLGAWIPPGYCHLMLSGHTHGGQVGSHMVGIPWSILRPLGVRDHGWWKAGGAPHYVHSGNWLFGLPPRMGIAGEIVVLEGESC